MSISLTIPDIVFKLNNLQLNYYLHLTKSRNLLEERAKLSTEMLETLSANISILSESNNQKWYDLYSVNCEKKGCQQMSFPKFNVKQKSIRKHKQTTFTRKYDNTRRIRMTLARDAKRVDDIIEYRRIHQYDDDLLTFNIPQT